jgi:hypothetical protein
MARHMRDLLFRPLALGDVLVRRHPAAAGHGMIHNNDGAAVGQLGELAPGLALRNRRHQLFDVLLRILRE